MADKMRPETLAVHADANTTTSEAANRFSHDHDVAPPIGVATTFENSPGGHIYSRMTNPTRERCERVLASVDSPGSKALLYSSGLAAAHAAIHACAADGKLRVAIDGGYHGTHLIVHEMQNAMGPGIESIQLPPPESAEKVLRKGDLVWLETPRNPECNIYDIEAYVKAAHAVGALVCVDSTFAPPPVQYPLDFGVDIVMHSTTKGLAGHSDAMGGALLVKDSAIYDKLFRQRIAIGGTPGSLETWLLLRSLRSLHVRTERQCRNAAAVASFLHDSISNKSHPLHGLVHSVRHPSLPTDPGHAIAKRQMTEGLYGSVLAVLLSNEQAAKALPASLRLFKDATSLGGVESLIEWRRKYDDKVDARLLRLSVGLEHEEDLKNDLVNGINAAHGTSKL